MFHVPAAEIVSHSDAVVSLRGNCLTEEHRFSTHDEGDPRRPEEEEEKELVTPRGSRDRKKFLARVRLVCNVARARTMMTTATAVQTLHVDCRDRSLKREKKKKATRKGTGGTRDAATRPCEL